MWIHMQMTLLIIFLFLLEKLFVQFSHFLFLIIEISFEITSKRVTMLSNKELMNLWKYIIDIL